MLWSDWGAMGQLLFCACFWWVSIVQTSTRYQIGPKREKVSARKLPGEFQRELSINQNRFEYLNPLIGIGHHGNQEVDQHNHRHQHINTEHNFEQIFRPIRLRSRLASVNFIDLRLLGIRLTEDSKEQQLEWRDWVHSDCSTAGEVFGKMVSCTRRVGLVVDWCLGDFWRQDGLRWKETNENSMLLPGFADTYLTS